MVKLMLGIIVETIVGFCLAGLILAIVVPVLNHYKPLRADDLLSLVVVVAVIVCVTAAVLIRPGGAIKRFMRRQGP